MGKLVQSPLGKEHVILAPFPQVYSILQHGSRAQWWTQLHASSRMQQRASTKEYRRILAFDQSQLQPTTETALQEIAVMLESDMQYLRTLGQSVIF